MKIQPVNSSNIKALNAQNYPKRAQNASSFVEFKRRMSYSANITAGVNLGLEIFNNPHEIQKIIKKYGDNIEIFSIDDCARNQVGDSDACILFNRDKNTFKAINAKIYATNPPKNKF